MGPVALVTNEIEDGWKLIERLAQEGAKVKAAAWIKMEDRDRWYLYIALPGVEKKGSMDAYQRIGEIRQQMPQPFLIETGETKVIDAKDPIAVAVADYERKYAGRGLLRYKGDRLGNVEIEGAYIYPAVTPTASPPQ